MLQDLPGLAMRVRPAAGKPVDPGGTWLRAENCPSFTRRQRMTDAGLQAVRLRRGSGPQADLEVVAGQGSRDMQVHLVNDGLVTIPDADEPQHRGTTA